MSIPFGDFNKLNLPKWDREMIESGFQAVQSVEGGWEFLKNYEPPKDKGFMFSTPPPKQQEIEKEIEKRYSGHSGASYAQTMRVLQYIAKYGWKTYTEKMLEEYAPPPLSDPALVAAPKNTACPCRMAKGFTSGWCGVAGGGVPGCDH